MRAFIVLSLVAVACADKLGYNYEPVAHANSGLSFPSNGAGAPNLQYMPPSGSAGGSGYGAPAASGYGASAGPNYGAPSGSAYGSPAGAAAPALESAPASAPAPSAPIAPATQYEKEYFSFAAPDIQEDHSGLQKQLESNLKKHLRVIFIKGPENLGLENAALNLAQHASEQQTAIYVLHKQADLSDLANKLNSGNAFNNQKPEVHFVKYRTAEDAANAQRAIQAQYDQLGGSTVSHNGGVAPVLNFASQPNVQGAAPQEPRNAYLPAAVFRQ